MHFIYQIYKVFQQKTDPDSKNGQLLDSQQNKFKLSLIVTGFLVCLCVGMFFMAKKYSLFAKYFANI